MSFQSKSLAYLLPLVVIAACSKAELDVSGKVTPAQGKTAPDSAAVQTVWGVSIGSPDYTYAFGEGTSSAATFDVSYAADPPDEALNAGLGVGVLLLVPTGDKVADGKIADENGLESKVIGGATAQVVIFKKAGADASKMPEWAKKFGDGYACGKTVPATGAGFDTFEPVDCKEVEIKVDDLKNLKFPNWT